MRNRGRSPAGGGHSSLGRSFLTTGYNKCAPELGTNDTRELGDRGQGERENGETFAEAATRVASKAIEFFPKSSERKIFFYEEGRVRGTEITCVEF